MVTGGGGNGNIVPFMGTGTNPKGSLNASLVLSEHPVVLGKTSFGDEGGSF
jgi:hypothetical protein